MTSLNLPTDTPPTMQTTSDKHFFLPPFLMDGSLLSVPATTSIIIFILSERYNQFTICRLRAQPTAPC
ncbi:unnamed protein product [Coffea canephora]|uniref:Uncharacterized protein n=1 Tax=Coffea canephora TaxID=49390 RepID=A0A068U3P8_COFCA|nr:unnamed protein product [Coffea canephora]